METGGLLSFQTVLIDIRCRIIRITSLADMVDAIVDGQRADAEGIDGAVSR